jgi:biotin-[acetyl-CoA-carboxylase] ligase BirA-like protein
MISKHYHELVIDSTQDLAMEKAKNGEKNFIVSCFEQRVGQGRNNRKWIQDPQRTLCFSFETNCNEVKTLSSLEMAVLIIKYFKKNKIPFLNRSHLSIKWPNDVINPFNKNKKIAGILINSFDEARIVVGIGVNIYPYEETSDYCSIYEAEVSQFKLNSEEAERLARNITEYILENRLSSQEVHQSFKELCPHLGKYIKYYNDKVSSSGTFQGIGPSGEAIILDMLTQENVSLFSGSLFYQ